MISFGTTPLVTADVNARMTDVVQTAQSAINDILFQYQAAQLGNQPPGANLPIVAVSFPRPGVFADPFGPSPSPWVKADEASSKLLWDAIDAHGVGPITITPEEVYSLIGGDSVLSCYEAAPVVKNLALYAIRPGAFDSTSLNQLGRTFAGEFGDTQPFADASGPIVYSLADDFGATTLLPVLYGEAEAARTTFSSAESVSEQRPLGVSPFGTVNVNFAYLNTASPTGFDDATEVVVLMRIDSRSVTSPLGWVGTCH